VAFVLIANQSIFALSLSDNTRIALYILPIWFLVLSTFYWLKTRRSAHQKVLIADFKQKVVEQNAAAAEYRARAISR
jgi:D-serine/D-alanine/glycine transporter